MSPRSKEFMDAAHEWLAGARSTMAAGFGPGTVSLAYYAMLYAARAALSEEDLYAKTHKGTWQLFRQTFVVSGKFEEELFGEAERTLDRRLGVDYEAESVELGEAEHVVELADQFLAAIEQLYPD